MKKALLSLFTLSIIILIGCSDSNYFTFGDYKPKKLVPLKDLVENVDDYIGKVVTLNLDSADLMSSGTSRFLLKGRAVDTGYIYSKKLYTRTMRFATEEERQKYYYDNAETRSDSICFNFGLVNIHVLHSEKIIPDWVDYKKRVISEKLLKEMHDVLQTKEKSVTGIVVSSKNSSSDIDPFNGTRPRAEDMKILYLLPIGAKCIKYAR